MGGDQVRTLRASGSSYPGGRPAAADTQGPADAKGPAMDAAGSPEQKACIGGVKCLQLDQCCALVKLVRSLCQEHEHCVL